MELPKEWLGGKTVLTAAEVKKMKPGEAVWRHQCYGRRGEHLFVKTTVIQEGKKKRLSFRDGNTGLTVLKDIVAADNIAYTLD